MLFTWEIVAVQFGCLGLWLWQRFNGWGLATVGILAAINIPHFIILGEFGIAVLLALLAKLLSRRNWTTALWAGASGGVGIFACYAIAYGITDGLIPPLAGFLPTAISATQW